MNDKDIKIHLILLYFSITSWVSSNKICIWHHSWKETTLGWMATSINKIQSGMWYVYYKTEISGKQIWKFSITLKLLLLLLLCYVIYLFILMYTIRNVIDFKLLLKQKVQNRLAYYHSYYHSSARTMHLQEWFFCYCNMP